ncbi:MAG: methyltransferase domain-containing protein [Chloroflexi bacterium]|nr:methyltransferase domain-containing protein [Chloroflexota bacterium]
MSEDPLKSFTERYAAGDMPWDSGLTPPEIFEVLSELPPGKALDLGCGTGTVMRDLLRKGWHADGIDFVGAAVDLARDKLKGFPAETCRLFRHDVTKLEKLPDLRPPYDLVIDIGCGHCIDKDAAPGYAKAIAKMLEAGGAFMLYASHPRPDSTVGWTPVEVERLFTPKLNQVWHQQGTDTAIGAASSWYRFHKI